MANMAVSRIKREFKEVMRSEEVCMFYIEINLFAIFWRINCIKSCFELFTNDEYISIKDSTMCN